MNKLLIPNGGMPFEGDDLLFMQEAFRLGFNHLIEYLSNTSVFNDNSCVLRGVNLNAGSGNITYSGGVVAIAGELCTLAGGIAVGAEGNEDEWWIELETFADPAGTQIFADAVSKDTYEVRRAKVTNSVGVPSAGAMRFDLLDSYKIITIWVPTAYGTGLSSNPSNPINVRKNHRYVTFSGQLLTDNSTPHGVTAFTIPEYFRPAYPKGFLAYGGSGTLFLITVNTNGVVTVHNHDFTGPDPLIFGSLGLECVHYPIN